MYQNKPYKLAIAYSCNFVLFYTVAKHCVLQCIDLRDIVKAEQGDRVMDMMIKDKEIFIASQL